jgi:hypothetical protein
MLTSYNGWPASENQAEIHVKPYPVKGTTLKIRCAKDAGELLAAFAAEFNTLIEPIDGGTFDDWAYAYRMVRGTTDKLSCHSSGTAIDLNATKHPLGKAGTFPLAKVPMIQALTKKYGLKSGGAYQGRKDEIHFEIAISREKAIALAKKLELVDA